MRCHLGGDGDAHLACGALDDLHRGVDVVGVEVGHLGLSDLADLRLGDAAGLDLVRLARALLQASGLEDESGRGRCLEGEVECAVLVDRDLYRDHVALLVLRGRVVGLAELHDVHTMLTEGGAYGRRGVRGTSLNLQLDQAGNLLLLRCHVGSFVGGPVG